MTNEQTTTVVVPDMQAFANENQKLIAATQSLTVVTHEQYLQAAEYGKRMKIAQNNVKNRLKDVKQKAKAAHSAVCDLENSLLKPLIAAEAYCDGQIKTYLQAEAKRQREENERLQKEAEALAKAEAEKNRLAQEEERLKTAEMLEAQGFREEANAVLSQESLPVAPAPIVVLAPTIQKPKAQGVALRDNWKAVIVEPLLLVQEIAAGRQPIGLLFKKNDAGHYELNEKALMDMAKALKAELRIPGVRPFNDVGVTKRVGVSNGIS